MSRFSNKYVELLSRKYLEGSLTEKERADFILWYGNIADESELPKAEDEEIVKERIREGIYRRLGTENEIAHKYQLGWKTWAIAASLILFAIPCYFVLRHKSNQLTTIAATDIKPGANRAYLTLANGKKIDLTGLKAGTIAQLSNGMKVSKSANNQLVYTIAETSGSYDANKINTLTTPAAGQYDAILADGTHVWLNSSSSLTYPEHFAKGERNVTLKGEAYFEVAHENNRPFKVTSANQVIQVVGTHFNINAYTDEATVRTTLLEGSVKIVTSSTVSMLKPGQQSSVVPGHTGINIRDVDAEQSIAWKNGLFSFSDDDLQSAMRKIGRWYDVDVKYTDESLKQLTFEGTITRYANVSNVLHMLELTKLVRFKIEGKSITVYHYKKP